MVQISLHFPDKDVEELDRLVREGYFQNRADAIRKGTSYIIKETREREREDNRRGGMESDVFAIE